MIAIDQRNFECLGELTSGYIGQYGDEITLSVPEVSPGVIMMGGHALDLHVRRAQLNVHILPRVVTATRQDERPIQACDVGAGSTNAPLMLHRPVEALQLVKRADEWLVNLEEEAVRDWCSVDYFVRVLSQFALKRRAERVDFARLVD